MTVTTAHAPPAISATPTAPATSATSATPADESTGRLPVRLSLKPPGPQSGLLDGAWWPRSRDLARELPSLTAALDPLWGRITRVAVNPTLWAAVPRKIAVDGRVVKTGWFTSEQDPHQLLLLSYRLGRWDLLIVPPETDAATAERLMAAACDPHPARTGSALIADAQAGPGTRPAEDWEAEGGAMAAASAQGTGGR